jgi:hypothetical protein
MALGFIEVEYRVSFKDSKPLVRGVQVGRFAVRHAVPGSTGSYGLPETDVAPWRVDHIPTGLAVAAFDNFDEAYALADDISRFSKQDPSGKTNVRAVAQLGPQIGEWMRAVHDPWSSRGAPLKYIPFRDWLAEQGKEWKPRRRLKPIKLFG